MKRSVGRRRGGFTLIEVLLVLVILVVLASLATVNVMSARRSAFEKAARAEAGTIDSALEMYNMDCNMYPPMLDALMQDPGTAPGRWKGPYLKKPPLDPWGQPYQYMVPGQNNPGGADVWTISPDTGQQIGNWQ